MSFKIGDKIRRKAAYEDGRYKDKVLTVNARGRGLAWFSVKEYPKLGYVFHENYWELVQENEMCPHPHAALIKQWADGATIEWRGPHNGEWVEVETPGWYDYHEYRIKPEPKPDIVREVNCVHTVGNISQVGISIYNPYNLKLIFDGETGKLKAAEVI